MSCGGSIGVRLATDARPLEPSVDLAAMARLPCSISVLRPFARLRRGGELDRRAQRRFVGSPTSVRRGDRSSRWEDVGCWDACWCRRFCLCPPEFYPALSYRVTPMRNLSERAWPVLRMPSWPRAMCQGTCSQLAGVVKHPDTRNRRSRAESSTVGRLVVRIDHRLVTEYSKRAGAPNAQYTVIADARFGNNRDGSPE